MTDEISTGNVSEVPPGPARARRFVRMQIGDAIVYVKDFGEPVVVEADDRIGPVSPPSPKEIFENASEILGECVRTIGERVDTLTALAERARPQQVTVEFSISFEVKGKASVIPVFVTGETGASTGLKVTAVWGH